MKTGKEKKEKKKIHLKLRRLVKRIKIKYLFRNLSEATDSIREPAFEIKELFQFKYFHLLI